MEIWTYNKECIDPEFRLALQRNVDAVQGIIQIQFSDGILEVSKRQAFLNLFWWPIVSKFGIPLRKDHFIKHLAPSRENLVHEWNRYYDEVMNIDFNNAKKLKTVIWDVWQDLYDFACGDLGEYVASLDLLDMVDIMHEPAMDEIIETKYKIKAHWGSDVIEKYIDDHSKKIIELLSTKGALQCEALYPFQHTKQLNKFQVPQVMYAYGMRTDISDNIIGLPVIGSALGGLNDVQEFLVESMSAKKTLFYNNTSVAESQYNGRIIQLITNAIEVVYTHDCESNVLIDFVVTPNNYQNLVGKLIYENGKPIRLNKDNVGSYVNTTVRMRSPMTCRFRRGVCSTCGGTLYNNINRKLNLGILSAIQVIEPTTQKILSAKHLVKTATIVYELPKGSNKLLYKSSTNEIRWRNDIADKMDTFLMGIPVSAFSNFHDVRLLKSEATTKEERFSAVTHFYIKFKNQSNEPKLFMLENNKQIPYLSTEMLFYMRDRYEDLVIEDDIVWIPVDGTEKLPIFRIVVINDNMLMFVKSVSKFLSSNIDSYTSCSKVLHDFSNVIYDKVLANITHIETILKAFMITSPSDYRIPLVTDPDNVLFRTVNSIINNRSIGPKLAYQNLSHFLGTPSTYLVPKQKSPFDLFTVGP